MLSRLVKRAFKKLESENYWVARNYWCCQSCAWSAIGDEIEQSHRGIAFYHRQDGDNLKNNGFVHIAHSGDTHHMVSILNTIKGLNVEWDGTVYNRIKLTEGDVINA